jgi:Family of unknown function (DUF5309)
MPDSTFIGGFLGTELAGVEARNDVTVAIRNWFANRNPLATRLPYVPVERVDFLMYTHKYRPNFATLTANVTSTSQDTLTLADTSFLMNHDLLRLTDSANGTEDVQVNGDPTSATTINVTRAVSNTTLQTTFDSATTTVQLIGNSRNGAEVNQTGLTTVGISRTQFCQTFQFPVQIGGSAQTTGAAVLPGGIQSPFDFNKTMQLQNMIDSIETTIYYGKAQAPSADNTVTAKANGLQSILVTNNVTSPTNASAYGPTDLIRDTLQSAREHGGEPDILLVSTNFMSAFATWGQAIQRIPAGETVFGVPINVLEAPFLHGVSIIEAPLMLPFSAFALTSSEVYIRNKRNPYWNLRGNRGDLIEGEWIAELAVECTNESHHAFVSGITAFSAT